MLLQLSLLSLHEGVDHVSGQSSSSVPCIHTCHFFAVEVETWISNPLHPYFHSDCWKICTVCGDLRMFGSFVACPVHCGNVEVNMLGEGFWSSRSYAPVGVDRICCIHIAHPSLQTYTLIRFFGFTGRGKIFMLCKVLNKHVARKSRWWWVILILMWSPMHSWQNLLHAWNIFSWLKR